MIRPSFLTRNLTQLAYRSRNGWWWLEYAPIWAAFRSDRVETIAAANTAAGSVPAMAHITIPRGASAAARRRRIWQYRRTGFSPTPGSRSARPLSDQARSEEHTSELQSLMRTSYAVLC